MFASFQKSCGSDSNALIFSGGDESVQNGAMEVITTTLDLSGEIDVKDVILGHSFSHSIPSGLVLSS